MKRILFLLIFSSVLINCSSSLKPISPSQYSKKEIDKKFPYWKCGISDFLISEEKKEYTRITIAEKRYALECMALMRLAVNIPEFVTRMHEYTNNNRKFMSSVEANLPNSPYNTYWGKEYDVNRLIEVIRTLEAEFRYTKAHQTANYMSANVGNVRYTYLGYTNKIYTGTHCGLPNVDWTQGIWGYNIGFMSTAFHEHMHNIGFNHKSGITNGTKVTYDTPSALQNIIGGCGRLALNKYKEDFELLKAYYFNEYRHHLLEDTVYDPNAVSKK